MSKGALITAMAAAAGAMLLYSSGGFGAQEPDNASPNGTTSFTLGGADITGQMMDMLGISNNTAVGDPQQNTQAFLDMITYSEIGPGLLAASDNGYNVVVGGSLFNNGYVDHPRIVVQTGYGYSDAAGRYQIMAAVAGRIKTNTWDWIRAYLGLTDFTPASQDAAAIELIRRAGALADVQAGNIQAAVLACNRTWASLTGSPYNQNPHPMDYLLSAYQNAGGALA